MFHDWNGNGRSDDAFDDYMEYRMLEEGTKHQGSGGGTCCLYMLLVPAGGIALLVHLVRLL